MKFSGNLTHAVIVSRYKRLIIDIKLDNGDIVPAFCPDFNAEYSNYMEGSDVWVSSNYNSNKKLKYNIAKNNSAFLYFSKKVKKVKNSIAVIT